MTDDPLSAVMPKEVPLAHPPLIRMVTQLRYPAQPAFDQRATAAPVLDALASAFPVVREEPFQGVIFKIGAEVAPESRSWTTWRLSDLEGKWRLSLSREFLALETISYHSHDDFIGRFRHVLDAFPPTLRPPVVDRFGLRYINRVVEPGLSQITQFVRSELLGVLASPSSARVRQSFTETICDLTPHTLIARYGILPPNASYDPGSLIPVPERSWLLDLDMYREQTQPFDIKALERDAKLFAEQIYTFFRWAVTDKLLAYFNEHPK